MCSIGKFLKDACDKTTHNSKIHKRYKQEFMEEELLILSKSCGMDNNDTSNEEFYVCLQHNAMYLQKYSRNQNKCSKPYKSHKSVVKAAPVEI